MCTFVDAGEVLEIKMGVDLCGTDAGVTQKFLHRPQVAAGFEQVRGEGMPEQVGMHAHREALGARVARDEQLHRAAAQAPAAVIEEQGVLADRGHRRTFAQPQLQRRQCLRAHRHDAGLVAFAGHAHGTVGQMQVAQIKTHQLGEPQPGGIQQLHHGQVARARASRRA